MQIVFSKENIQINSNRRKFTFGHIEVWFKGYFYYQDRFYEKGKAAEKIKFLHTLTDLESAINKLNGVFTAVVINKKKHQLSIVNDRYGFGHLFYINQEDRLLISDNYWHLVGQIDKPEVNKMAAYEMLRFRYVLRGHTLVRSIKEILPSSIYSIKCNHEIEINRIEYWKFKYSPIKISANEAEEKVHQTLDNIIRRYSRDVFKDSEIGINLTGGVDSRYILSLLLTNGICPENITAFTFGAKNCEDIKIASQVAETIHCKHNKHIFPEPFYSFFEEKTIDSLINEIGFSSFYFQAYGISTLIPKYTNTDYLLTGADGFYVGLVTDEELFDIKDTPSLSQYILHKNATILNHNEVEFITENRHENYEKKLLNNIEQYFKNKEIDSVSDFFDWTIKNRMGKYILSIHEMLNKNTTNIYPFYDYEFFDLMSKLPFEALFNQSAYINAMYKNAFVNKYKKLGEIPIEKRRVKHNGNNYNLEIKRRNLLQKIIKHLFILPDKNFTYPIFKTFRRSQTTFTHCIQKLLVPEQKYFNITRVLHLITLNRRKEHFFKYGLLALISVLRFENIISNIRSNKTIE